VEPEAVDAEGSANAQEEEKARLREEEERVVREMDRVLRVTQ
jgi:hypothetical protein